MTDLYLIAHKVRGEPAFDVACRVQIGEEEGWIIPTSGWRAYPYDYIRLWAVNSERIKEMALAMPESLRDHFAPAPSGGKITALSLADLGL